MLCFLLAALFFLIGPQLQFSPQLQAQSQAYPDTPHEDFQPVPEEGVLLFGTGSDGQLVNRFLAKGGEKYPQWQVEGDVLVSTPGKGPGNSNHVYSDYQFRDAEIHVEFLLPPGQVGNSGVYIHGNYEMQILNSIKDRNLTDQCAGSLYKYFAPKQHALLPIEHWQSYKILYTAPRRDESGTIVRNGQITAWLNGVLVQDRVQFGEPVSVYHPYRYGQTKELEEIWASQKKTSFGPVFLQDHGFPVKFRNVWVRPIDDTPALPPTSLRTDMLLNTQTVWKNGYPVGTLDRLDTASENTASEDTASEDALAGYQYAEIRTVRPSFGWVVNDWRRNVRQSAYEIQVSSSYENCLNGKADVCSTGKIVSDNSSCVFLPQSLEEGKTCFWRVKTWNISDDNAGDNAGDNSGENSTEMVSDWSEVKVFRIGTNLQPFEVSRYPIELIRDVITPNGTAVEQVQQIDSKTVFYDFGKAAFGKISVEITAPEATEVKVRVGERKITDEQGVSRVNRKPAGSTRYWEYTVPVEKGTKVYTITTRTDRRNTTGAAFLMPAYIGEVMPFRYAEVESAVDGVKVDSVVREWAHYPFDNSVSSFSCSNDVLNQVWDLCKYSIEATSFLGVYVDGDRERIPYEGDALLNQLSHYCVDSEYTMARRTAEYLIFRPTWPTEWSLQIPQMFWYDYLYTGDTRAIERYYDEIRAKAMFVLSEENGLISTRKGKVNKDFLASIHFPTNQTSFRDIVDWPHKGLAGNENANSGETDGFEFNDFNSVVNAYHYFACNSMNHFATILGKTDDAEFFRNRSEQIKQSYQEVFFDSNRGVYRDGEKTEHASLHGNMFPLAFGLVPPEHVKSVTDFVISRKLACSVYGAQFLLDAVYNGNNGQYGLELMASQDVRSWYNMIRVGSTISLEAWDDRYKPNQDWNHAWGAAPANVIPRKLIGVEPLEPAAKKLRIKPQIADLQQASAVVPTIRGLVKAEIRLISEPIATPGYEMTVTLPANTQSEVWLPVIADGLNLYRDGAPCESRLDNGFRVIDNVGSGTWKFELRP